MKIELIINRVFKVVVLIRERLNAMISDNGRLFENELLYDDLAPLADGTLINLVYRSLKDNGLPCWALAATIRNALLTEKGGFSLVSIPWEDEFCVPKGEDFYIYKRKSEQQFFDVQSMFDLDKLKRDIL